MRFSKTTTQTPEVGKIIALNPPKIAIKAIILHTFGVQVAFFHAQRSLLEAITHSENLLQAGYRRNLKK